MSAERYKNHCTMLNIMAFLFLVCAYCSTSLTLATRSKASQLRMGAFVEELEMAVSQLSSNHDVILGIPWLERHEPAILWKSRELTLTCCGCRVRIRGEKLRPIAPSGASLAVQVISAKRLAQDL